MKERGPRAFFLHRDKSVQEPGTEEKGQNDTNVLRSRAGSDKQQMF